LEEGFVGGLSPKERQRYAEAYQKVMKETGVVEDDFGIPGNEDPVVPSDGEPDDGVVSPGENGTGRPAVGSAQPVPIPPDLGVVNMEEAISPEARRLQELVDAAGIDPASLVSDIKACGWDAALICGRFSFLTGPDRSTCQASVEGAVAQCNAYRARGGSDLSVSRCQADCEAHSSEARTGLLLYQLARNMVQSVESPLGQRLLRLKAERERLLSRQLELQNAVENKILHIYINSETNALVVHDGRYFEPRPPLVYSGTSRRPATPEQLAAKAGLTQRLKAVANAMEDMQAQIAASDDEGWRRAALSYWDAIIGRGGADSCKDVSQVEASLFQCRAYCAAQGEPNKAIGFHGPVSTDFCKQSTGTLRSLMSDDSRRWLLPPSARAAN
ncbi:MAG: hypothetical protein K8F25_18160, partial [Fimbriimonadaceae bacterium]|nr:hypothetical protein [Alphaproteobacteria bacterium]